jgi:hypothetical protein
MNTPVLQDKNAIVFSAGGSTGAVVAKKFAAEDAVRTETTEGKGYGDLSRKRVLAWREFGSTP